MFLFSLAFSNSVDLSTKHKMNLRNVKKNIPKLVFLDPTSTQICKEPKSSFKSTRKNFRQNVKDPLTKAKSTRWVTQQAYQNKLAGIMIDILQMIHKIIDWALSLYQPPCQTLDLQKQTNPHNSFAR